MSQRNPQNERYTVEREGRAPGATRPHAGAAKPASKAAASVRIQTSKSNMSRKQKAMAEATMSKEEKKAQRAKERELENLVYTATTVLTNKDAQYKKLRRIWWGLLIAAVVFTALSWATLAMNVGAVLSGIVLVLAYAGIIGALVMDFTVIRKRRNVFRDKVNAMSRKQVERVVEESYVERQAADAAKKAKKEAKKAGATAEEQKAAADAAFNDVTKKTSFKVTSEEEAAKFDAKQKAKEAAKAAEGVAPKAAEPSPEEAAEEARKAAAAKAARDFAASKGRS